jgi:hypothetical protein
MRKSGRLLEVCPRLALGRPIHSTASIRYAHGTVWLPTGWALELLSGSEAPLALPRSEAGDPTLGGWRAESRQLFMQLPTCRLP